MHLICKHVGAQVLCKIALLNKLIYVIVFFTEFLHEQLYAMTFECLLCTVSDSAATLL